MLLDQLTPDYLLRLKQERDTMLAYILAEKTAGSDDSPRLKIEAECLRRIGVPLGVVSHTAPEGLTQLIRGGGNLAYRSLMLAELLLQYAQLGEEAGDIRQAAGARLQAFCLIAEWIHVLGDEDQMRYRAKMDELSRDLNAVSSDPYLQGMISQYAAKI